jgi:hypothetical protein
VNLINVGLARGRRAKVLRRHALDSDSAYRRVARHGQTVEVEVLSAPGLRPGTHMRVTAAAARAMAPSTTSASERAIQLARSATHLLVARGPKLKRPVAWPHS